MKVSSRPGSRRSWGQGGCR